MSTSIPLFTLNNNVKIPAVGFGTYRIRNSESTDATKNAALAGYRLIDSAIGYGNEAGIGKAIKELCADKSLGLTRKDFFISTKLPTSDHGYDKCYDAVLKSLKRFDTDYLDLFLIHWPGTQGLKPNDPKNKTNRQESWKAMEKLYSEGKLRAIGVCNYTTDHLTHLLANCSVKPAIHQFELHPLLYHEQKEIIKLTKDNNIRIEAYSSLGQGHLVNGKKPLVTRIADKHKVTEAQVLLRWGYQHDAIVLPKSVTPERIKTNSEIFHFELSKEDMDALNKLGEEKVCKTSSETKECKTSSETKTCKKSSETKIETKRFCWDPTKIV